MRSTFGHHNCMHPRRHRLLSAHFLRHRWNLQARRVVAVHRRQVYPTPENSVTAGPDFASSSDFALSPDFALSSDFALGPDFAPCPSPDFAPSNSPLPTRQIVPVLLLPLYALPECASRYWEGDRVIYTLAYCMPLYSPSDRYDPADRSQRMHKQFAPTRVRRKGRHFSEGIQRLKRDGRRHVSLCRSILAQTRVSAYLGAWVKAAFHIRCARLEGRPARTGL